MKTEITSLDLKFLVNELKENLVNGKIRKIYSLNKGKFLFEIYTPKKGKFFLYFDGTKIFLASKRTAEEPSGFCMFLRKRLMGENIEKINQREFDRIIEIKTKNYILIFEMIHPGNLILCDLFYEIINCLKKQEWKDRVIKPKLKYEYPPSFPNPFTLNFNEFKNSIKNSEKKLIVFLARDLGFGGEYAKEICLKAKLNENEIGKDLSEKEIKNLHETIKSIEKIKLKPTIYEDSFSPFPLEIYEEKKSKETKTFSQCLEKYFLKLESEDKEEVKKREKLEKILNKQKEAIKKWEETEKKSREIAEKIYENYALIQKILGELKNLREGGFSWKEIKEKLNYPEIKEIKEKQALIIFILDGKEIQFDFRKSIEENAANYYEKAKKAKKKIQGAQKAIKEQKEKLERIKPKKEKPKEKKKQKWFEKFKWFISSDGILVIAGKDATSNEILIKKHTEPENLVFHADIPGAAFVVIKSKDSPEQTKKEAAEFAAVNSKAWQNRFGVVDVYCVKPKQVSKKPPSGEYLPKGSFMIYGEKEWFKNIELKFAIGWKGEIISGPVEAVKNKTKNFVILKPGFKKSLELAKEIKKRLIKKAGKEKETIQKIPLETIQKLIPSGKGEIAK